VVVCRMAGRQAGGGRGRGRGKVITDPRFARVQTDARFQVFPNKQRTVEIDERFQGAAPAPHRPVCLVSLERRARLFATNSCASTSSPHDVLGRRPGLFNDKDFQVRAPVDKRGRKARDVLRVSLTAYLLVGQSLSNTNEWTGVCALHRFTTCTRTRTWHDTTA